MKTSLTPARNRNAIAVGPVAVAAAAAALFFSLAGSVRMAYAQDQTPAPPVPPTPPSSDGSKSSHRFQFGPEVGVFLPTDSKTRNTFGSTWFNLGIGLGGLPVPKSQGEVGFDFRLYSMAKSGRSAIVAPLGISYRRAMYGPSAEAGPYVGATVNYVLTQLRSDSDGLLSRVRGGAGASLFAGFQSKDNAYIQARYLFVSRIRGYDLSGLSLAGGYRF